MNRQELEWNSPDSEAINSVWNEFAEVHVAIDTSGLTPRLVLKDAETGVTAYLDPLELTSLIYTPDELRVRWLQVGAYTEG